MCKCNLSLREEVNENPSWFKGYPADVEGFRQIQLWQLCSIFGKHCYLGAEPFLEHAEIIKV